MSPQSHAPSASVPAPPCVVTSPSDESSWFKAQVHPHQDQLRSYLRKQFPTVQDVDDVVQESYLRLLKVRNSTRIQSVKAFLFGIANHLAIDIIRKGKRIAARVDIEDITALNVMEDGPDAAEVASVHQEVALLAEAIHSLPRRCREIMILRKLEHLSHQEIAGKLGISPSTVEAQVNRGMKLLASFLRDRGVVVGPRKS